MIIIEDPEECHYSKPIIILLLITIIMATVFIVLGNIIEAIWTIIIMLSFMITLLFINKKKYFKSKQWQRIKFAYTDDIKMINTLSSSIRSSLKTYACDINLTLPMSKARGFLLHRRYPPTVYS